jgi:hypothetical protein
MEDTIQINHEVVNINVDLSFDRVVDFIDFVGESIPEELEEIEDSHFYLLVGWGNKIILYHK